MSEFFDRLTAQVKAWDTEEMPGVDVGLLLTAARKVLAGPSPEAVQAAAKVLADNDCTVIVEWHEDLARSILAAAFSVDFGDPT